VEIVPSLPVRPNVDRRARIPNPCEEVPRVPQLRWHVRLLGAAVLLATGSLGCAPSETTPRPFQPVEATIPGIEAALRSGDATCRQVVQSYLDRIAAYDDSTGLNAITVVNPRALERADSLDGVLDAAGPTGALFCVPVLVKDNYNTHDMETTGGSIALKGHLPGDDATVVTRIRDAGAIIVAKTNMAEWAFSARQTVSSSFDTTANAYALDRVPAGSSGGTASGVAASFGAAGFGTDTGNSIRGPSSHLALFGIRSTLGLVSRAGVVPLVFDRDVAGPMTRTVGDAARILNVIAGYDPRDSYTAMARGHVAGDYTRFLDPEGLRGARIGVLRALAKPAETDSSVLRIFDRAVDELRAGGAEIVDPFVIPHLQEHLDADNFCPRFRYDMHRYLEARGGDTPITDVNQVLETGQYSPYVEEDLRSFADEPLDVPPAQWDPPCPDFSDHPGRQAFLREVVAAMDSAGVDAIAYPSWTYSPAHLDRAKEEYRGDNSQLIAPPTGMPASTVPMGFSYGKFPVGLQLLARPWDEGVLFELSYAYEQETHHRRPPPGFPPLDGGR